jgi:hypothetical protein
MSFSGKSLELTCYKSSAKVDKPNTTKLKIQKEVRLASMDVFEEAFV